ncbi:MAG: nucleotidyl transferase AbiEii/AbiGii toxin family protein [Catenibacterium sp.]|jgi:predicted nucleotidyltransferase component of viral defense system|uniref:nucleotidyl transferase AbiEii/AbiGii toxin family protein n=1 Tax=Catenibacterium sp. TaxID=2049022 RepID=UPI001EBC04A9|nr:nucleotidyl transferase AbiEii/AbiGii toxin family protein [Catenibacterium sp.]MBS5593719.1 nucleotidyl transferase AbiEii/AbiGii toxin family protein [Catenibacterium sp.]
MNPESVKARLKNMSVKEGGSMQDNLFAYALERSIYRLSISEYADRFTLKGGVFLYALFNKQFTRVTKDIDLLADKIPNDTERMRDVFREIFSIEYDDAIRFDLNSLNIRSITEFKEYHGVNISINAYLGRTRMPVSIDVGFGDVVYPDRVEMDFPVILDMDSPKIYAYSICSVIAEKFEAIVSLGLINGRYKDFYDIYVLVIQFDLVGLDLQKAIQETFSHRGTTFNDIVAFEEDFVEDNMRNDKWNNFMKKKKVMGNINFKDTIEIIKSVLLPIVNSIQLDQEFDKLWSCKEKNWI